MVIDFRSNGKFHAVTSAYLSIIAGLMEAVFSLLSGHAELSMSLYGIALMAVVDVTGATLILIAWQNISVPADNRTVHQKIQEARYSYIIGVLMMALGLFLVADSAMNLIAGNAPNVHNDSGRGTNIAVFGTVASFVLAGYKYKVGEELDSSVISADAVSTLCSALTSLVALVVLLTQRSVWWLDGFAGVMVAFYTLYSGAATMTSSSHELGSLLFEVGSREKGTHSSPYQKLAAKYRNYSYQQDSSSNKGRGSRNGEEEGSARLIEIMNARPTPYNFDNENRSQLSVFRAVYDRLNVFGGHTNESIAYERISMSDDDEDMHEVTFTA